MAWVWGPKAQAGYSPLASGTGTHSWRARDRASAWLRSALLVLALFLLSVGLSGVITSSARLSAKPHCHSQIALFTSQMKLIMEGALKKGLDPELGRPTHRHPRTAIVNCVGFHTEVVSALAFHFMKLHHNVSIWTRTKRLYGMNETMATFSTHFRRRNVRHFKGFFQRFYDFDTVVFATFPTCHLDALRELLSFKLPQRYLAVVHNPGLLNEAGVAEVMAEGNVRLLTIAPHVLRASEEVLEGQGVRLQRDWFVPIMPVLYPEECNRKDWSGKQAPCLKGRLWPEGQPPQPKGWRQGQRTFCIQGILDPTRRNYQEVFQQLQRRAAALTAANASLALVGKINPRGGGLRIPDGLLQAGLVRHYSGLPFQEFYEVLHSCLALVPAFSSPAYYIDKGSSSVGTALTAGTPLVATPALLRTYSFLDESAVFLVPEGTSDIEAMLEMLKEDPEAMEARRIALASLRMELYSRNLVALQRLLGQHYLYQQKAWRPATDEPYQNFRVA